MGRVVDVVDFTVANVVDYGARGAVVDHAVVDGGDGSRWCAFCGQVVGGTRGGDVAEHAARLGDGASYVAAELSVFDGVFDGTRPAHDSQAALGDGHVVDGAVDGCPAESAVWSTGLRFSHRRFGVRL